MGVQLLVIISHSHCLSGLCWGQCMREQREKKREKNNHKKPENSTFSLSIGSFLFHASSQNQWTSSLPHCLLLAFTPGLSYSYIRLKDTGEKQMAQYHWFSGTSNLVFFSDQSATIYSSEASNIISMHLIQVLQLYSGGEMG